MFGRIFIFPSIFFALGNFAIALAILALAILALAILALAILAPGQFFYYLPTCR
jgi:hypothetical protein